MIETHVHTFDGTVCNRPPTGDLAPDTCLHGNRVHVEWLLPEVPD